MTEPESAGNIRIALDELAQSIPRFGRRSDLGVVFEYIDDQRAGEGGAEHRGPAKKSAIARPELIDACRNECLDGLGQLLRLVGLLADARELLEEQRVAGSALHQGCQLDLGQTPAACRCDGERLRVVHRQRLEPQGQRRERWSSLRGREAAFTRSSRRAREPGLRGKLRSEVAKQLGRRVVHPVHVVEDDQGRLVEQVSEQRCP